MSALDNLRTDNLILLIGSNPLPNYIAAQLLARYIQEIANKRQASGYHIDNDLLAHIFPTSTTRINFLGNYSFRDESTLATRIS